MVVGVPFRRFLYLSLDELIQMHEGSSVVSALLVPLVIALVVVSLPLLWRLPRRIAYFRSSPPA